MPTAVIWCVFSLFWLRPVGHMHTAYYWWRFLFNVFYMFLFLSCFFTFLTFFTNAFSHICSKRPLPNIRLAGTHRIHHRRGQILGHIWKSVVVAQTLSVVVLGTICRHSCNTQRVQTRCQWAYDDHRTLPLSPSKGAQKSNVKSHFAWRKSATKFLRVKIVSDSVTEASQPIVEWTTSWSEMFGVRRQFGVNGLV